MNYKKILAFLFILILILLILCTFFPNSQNNFTTTSSLPNNNSLVVKKKDSPKYFNFYSIYSYPSHNSKEQSQYSSSTIFYSVLYEFTESIYDFVIYSEEINYTEDLFDNYNILVFLTMSDYSFALNSDGIHFENENEEYLTLNLIETVHKNNYNNGNSNPIYMQPQYYGGIILLPKQYILQDIQFNIQEVDTSSKYMCDKYYGRDDSNVFGQTLLTPALSKKHNFQQHHNRNLYKNNI